MDQDRLEYGEASQGGKRRSSLGALSKSKPVTKLKSMFEAKGPAPKIKESGLLGKLKPISASHDAGSFAAALSGSMASLKMSVGGPLQQPPATPIAPLFSVLPAPAEPDVLPHPSPPRSAEDLQMGLPVYQESLPDGGDADARKSPGSAGFLKRMSSSLKKALTPKSSTGKQKAEGFSPSYAGSEASNMSPRPSGQLLMTPGSQPSSTSMDLNCRSDQTQSAPTRSPPTLMGYEVHVTRDYPEWARSCEGGVDSTFRPTSSSSRPPRSPIMVHAPSGSTPDGVSAQHEASPPITSRDVSPRPLPITSPDQSQVFKGITLATGTPMMEESLASADGNGPASGPTAHDVAPDNSFAASLTASPTVPDCSDGSHGSPPMREVNMGAAIFSSSHRPSTSNLGTDACDIVTDLQADELVFPSLLSTDPHGPTIHTVEAIAIQVSDGLGAQTDESTDVDMGACDSEVLVEEVQSAIPIRDEMPNAARAATDTDTCVSLMEVDSTAQQEPVFQQPRPLASRRSFGAAGSLNLDLSGAVNSPGSPDTATPTGEGNALADSCIVGLTPVRPDTAAMCAMNFDISTLSTVTEGSPEASPPAADLPIIDLENNFRQAHAMHNMDIEQGPSGTIVAQELDIYDVEPPSSVGDDFVLPEEHRACESPAAQSLPPLPVLPDTVGPVVVGTDMDWDDSADHGPCAVTIDASQQPGLSALSDLPVAMPNAVVLPVGVTCEEPSSAGIQALADVKPANVCLSEVVTSVSASPAQHVAPSTLQQVGYSTNELEVAGQGADPLLSCTSAVVPDGIFDHGDLSMPSACGPEQIHGNAHSEALEVCMDNVLAQHHLGVSVSADCSVGIGNVVAICPVLDDMPSSEVEAEQVVDAKISTLEAVTHEGAGPVAAAMVPFPDVESPVELSKEEAVPSAEIAAPEQTVPAMNESDNVTGLSLEEDAQMEDTEVVSACVMSVAGQSSCAIITDVGTVQVPESPFNADEKPLALQPSTTSELAGSYSQDAALSAAVSDAAPLGTHIQQTFAQEQLVQGVLVEADELNAEDLPSAPCSPTGEAEAGAGTSREQHELAIADVMEAPQDIATCMRAPSFRAGRDFGEVDITILPDVQLGDSAITVPDGTQATETAWAESVDLNLAEHSQAKPQTHTVCHAIPVEVAATAIIPSDMPADASLQPMVTDTDLMDVDSSGAGVHLEIATTSCATVVEAAPACGEPNSEEVPVSQPLELLKPAASEGAELHQSPMAPHIGCPPVAVGPGDPEAVDLRSMAGSSAAIDVGIVAAAAAPTQALASPAEAQVIAPQTEAVHYVTAPPDDLEDDPMMVSPMPQRWSTLQPMLPVGPEKVMPQVFTDIGALDGAPSTSPMPGAATEISPDSARIGVRAFQLNEEPAVSVEAQICVDMPVQEHMTLHGGHLSAETPDALAPPLQSISPVTDSMNIGTVTPVTTADGPVHGNASTTTAADVESAVVLPAGASAPDLIASVPSVAAPPPLRAGEDVPMADSLEAIEALWGNDDLLEEPGSAIAKGCLMPQVASSPVSTSKPLESPLLSQSGRKVAMGVVLQIERESLDLFSLRNSCASRVSDSLMVESLESLENVGLCTKSRAIGFVPMAPLKEGDEDAAVAGRMTGSEGGSGTTSAGPQSPNLTFPVNNSGSPDSQATPGINAGAATPAGTPSANKPAACSSGGRGNSSSAAAGMVKAPGSAAKAATPAGAARANATPSTALKAMAAANVAGASASKACVSKRPLPVTVPQPRQVSTPGQQQVAVPSGASSGSRLPGLVATPAAGANRAPVPPLGIKPPIPSTSASATPSAVSGRPGVTPRSGAVFSSGKGQNQVLGTSRPGLFAHQPAVVGRPGGGLFDTPVIFRAAAVPLADTPFSASDFDLDTVDISAEASKAIALLGGGDASIDGTPTQHATPVLATVRGAVVAGTPTLSVLETHVQLLTNKLAEAEDNINQLQNANAMLRDQLSTLQFKLSMTNDLDMERDAREYLEHELSTLRHQSVGLEADLRAAHAEIKRHEQASVETLAAQQSKEAEWARKEVEMEQRMQQMASDVEAARSFAQQADARITEAEARAAAATAKCDEETARSRELQVTLGLQAHQLVQVQRARDDAEAKFQRAMEQLIAAQTSHKKAVVEYEQKLLQSSNLVSQVNDVRDKYRQMKQHAANAEQRAQHAEAKAQETANALAKANMEKAELMQMCNELLTQLEATKVKGGR
ncbi:hypothetical protein Vretimale_10174 [Volvox reticuliferus]|uniref:Uncharacterized protein n=1 Tax=Volvox reticuliferus TaxID=1737510 RepID=A0A8J4BUI6_9CHLO|nr:hypothetical protein Vretifemale_597 [Volvox reticuliferus]GIM05731.1 hypothetical protein Vretimale_10174 [Volvox reticuliferus]